MLIALTVARVWVEVAWCYARALRPFRARGRAAKRRCTISALEEASATFVNEDRRIVDAAEAPSHARVTVGKTHLRFRCAAYEVCYAASNCRNFATALRVVRVCVYCAEGRSGKEKNTAAQAYAVAGVTSTQRSALSCETWACI